MMAPSTLNIITKGIFKKINSPKDNMINFCWCLFFIRNQFSIINVIKKQYYSKVILFLTDFEYYF